MAALLMEVVRKINVPDLPFRIKATRENDGRSVQVLATLAEISTAYWYQLESGKRKWVSEDVIRRIEKVLGVDLGVTFDD
ncbi:helix-turn-helix transcriptional regulator [Chroococcus sp. FPU101]|uniref:helix-turn-helix domain-containing protein n=1 Tax=Chroococcus sp. FPU101 TaxID=1974212 RepID=UPI001A8E31C0|nr:helix-turn-helix transcriptional regulator [Chroococcus sp. FPU101]GFE71812.1 Transcriptional regulator, XRE family protein [Chroococcus sp. FPU101]